MKTSIVRKSTAFFHGTVYLDEDNHVVAQLDNAVIRVLFKINPKQPDSGALINKSSATSDILIVDSNAGTFEFQLTSTDTDLTYNQLYYEVVTQLSNGAIVRSGVLTLYIDENVVHQ